jgi:hypothetical protein
MVKKLCIRIFLSFYTRHKKYRFFVKLRVRTKNIEIYALKFCHNFFTFWMHQWSIAFHKPSK